MRRKVSICFIGCGQFCRCFVPLFKKHPDVDYVAVCDLIPEKAKEIEHWKAELLELLGREDTLLF